MPVIISRNAPTSLAVEMAYFLGITLVGFVRGQRMNVYTYPERVVLGS
jgi:FdhD protein